MDTALPQKFPFILDRNLAKANCTGNRVCTSCDTVVLDINKFVHISNGKMKYVMIYFFVFYILSVEVIKMIHFVLKLNEGTTVFAVVQKYLLYGLFLIYETSFNPFILNSYFLYLP